MRQLYTYVNRYASHPNAELALFLVAFAEASFFPVKPDVLLIAMVIVNHKRAFRYAFICTAGSVIGGVFGYMIGLAAYQTVGSMALDFYGGQEGFTTLQDWYHNFDVYIVGVAGFSPIPYKIFTLFSGFMGMNITSFITASIIARGARFFLISWLLWRGGASVKGWIETNLYPMTMAASIGLIFAIVLIKYMLQ